MAAAEVRAAWQRATNCRIIQEDARRASKFSGCPSPSSSNLESDGAPGDFTTGRDHVTPVQRPQKPNSNFPSNVKWWLHLQHDVDNQKDIAYERHNTFEAEIECLNTAFIDKNDKSCENLQIVEESSALTMHNDKSLFEQSLKKVPATCTKNELGTGVQELKATLASDCQKDVGGFWCPDNCLIDLEFNCLVSEQPKKLSSDLESEWMGVEKAEPWWRIAGKDELASLVAQKSLEQIENCDLPQPLNKHLRKGPSASMEFLDYSESFASPDWTTGVQLHKLASHVQGSPNSASVYDGSNVSRSRCASDRLFRGNNDSDARNKDELGYQNASVMDPSKAQLLEALCHSQTRAREAEEAAEQAYNDKEHVLMLFFRQASQLFAYKQWLHILQLENFYLQLKNKNGPISTFFPSKKKCQNKGRRRKHRSSGYEISKCAVAFAVGLGLAGAGLLLGWTMGWLFPTT